MLRYQLVALVAVAALAGCDRADRGPAKTASMSSPVTEPRADSSLPPPGTDRPDPKSAAPRPDASTTGEPPVQGQADARQAEQKQHFDNKS